MPAPEAAPMLQRGRTHTHTHTPPLGWAVLILLLNPPGVGMRAKYTKGVGLGFEEQHQAQ